MSVTLKLNVRTKIIMMIIPLLICGFAVNGYISVASTHVSLLNQASLLIRYKISQFESYASRQWENLEKSGLSEEQSYVGIVEKSLANYASGMIQNDAEYIFVTDYEGELKFSTGELDYDSSAYPQLKDADYFDKGGLYRYYIGEKSYYGLSASLSSSRFEVFVIEEADSFTDEIRSIMMQQILSFIIILTLIVVAMIILLTAITAPIQKFRNTIHEIIEYKDFSRRVEIEYPDEIGDLAYDFNFMISNFDLAYSKIKDYALNEAIARKELNLREYETLDVLARASDYKDPETAAHIARVSNYALLLAELLGLDEESRELIYYATPLHDIGKLGIPDAILLKPGRLTDGERTIMYNHTTIGYEIMQNPKSKYLRAGALIAMSHHEYYDGSGYPKGLKGDEIPLFGRIVSLVDVFDALTTKRPYKEAWSFERATEEIAAQRGKHFDPELVDIFLSNLPRFREVFEK